MAKMYLNHPERADLCWEIVSYDKATKIAVLQGQYARIEVPFDIDALKAKGYRITKGNDDAKQPGVQT